MGTTETVLLARVRARCNVAATDSRLLTAEIEYFLNDAINFLGVQSDWPWHRSSETINTVDGTDAYTISTDARVVRSIVIPANDKVLREITNRTAQEYGSLQEGIPTYYVLENRTITLYPTPGQVYAMTHFYYTYMDQLTTGSDQVDSPATFDSLIVTKASIYVAEKLRDSELAQRLDLTFRHDLEQMQSLATNSRASIGINIRDDWGV